jgi:hypothetical protein
LSEDEDRDIRFIATGPGNGPDDAGFKVLKGAGFPIGVLGRGERYDNAQSVGVMGVPISDLRLTNGVGVVGLSDGVGGVGVQGGGTNRAIGVQGKATGGGVAVEGTSDGVGVIGFGDLLGVQGTSDTVGVLGGPPLGKVFGALGTINAGVVGNAIGDVSAGDVPFAYGGWFDGLNGTAPLHLEPSAAAAPPAAAKRGDFFVDNAGRLFFCTDDGNPATWKQVQLV